MQHNFILQLIFAFSIFLGMSKINNDKQHSTMPLVQAAAQNDAGNKHQDKTGTTINPFTAITDGNQSDDHGNHHDHEDGKFHQLCFDRIRRKEGGFSIGCAVAKLLVIILQIAVLVFTQYQVLHPVQPEIKVITPTGATQHIIEDNAQRATIYNLLQ